VATARRRSRICVTPVKTDHDPYKFNTLIFLLEDDAQDCPDHVDAHRAPVMSPAPMSRIDTLYYDQHAAHDRGYSRARRPWDRLYARVLWGRQLRRKQQGGRHRRIRPIRPLANIEHIGHRRYAGIVQTGTLSKYALGPGPSAEPGEIVEGRRDRSCPVESGRQSVAIRFGKRAVRIHDQPRVSGYRFSSRDGCTRPATSTGRRRPSAGIRAALHCLI
jgi:hypothetical protein